MYQQSIKSVNAQFFSTLRKCQFKTKTRNSFGVIAMTRQIKDALLVLIVITASLMNATNASAQNAGTVRTAYRNLENAYSDLQTIKAQIVAFDVKDPYCKRPDPNNKAAAKAALKALRDAANRKKGSYRGNRAALHNLVVTKGLGGALDAVVPDGSEAVATGEFFAKYEKILLEIEDAYYQKRDAIRDAQEKRCGGTPTVNQGPAFAVVNPLMDVSTTGTYEEVAQISTPNRFCHADEKRELLDRIYAMRRKAQANEVVAEKLRDRLRQLETQTKAKRQTAWNAADAAAKTGETTTQNNQVKQLRAYDAALKKIAAGIRQAQADQRKWRNRDIQLKKDWDTVAAMPISDCTDPNLTPAGTIGGSQIQGIGDGIAAPTLKPVEIPSIPKKVCVDAVKKEIETKAFTALRNSWYNRDQWSARINALNTALQAATGDARQPLINARNEARKESAKWIKLVKVASDAKDQANAIIVENCATTGGLLEVGKLSSALPGVYVGVPEAETKPYDLPDVPEYVCTWEEKQALVERASKAREVASYNHSQWGPRATAIGKLLYGENAVDGDRTELLKAYAEARVQSDYWAEQMLEVAHRVYWELRDLEVRDCEQPENKTSMGYPSDAGSGNAYGGQNASAGSIDDALENARRGAPVFNGGSGSSGYGPIGNGYPPVYGYPDFNKVGLGRQIRRGYGFDGSEAENALDDTLRSVERTRASDYGRTENNSMPANDRPATPRTGNTSNGAPSTYGGGKERDVKTEPKTEPKTGGSMSAPYPGHEMPSDPKKGGSSAPKETFSSNAGLELETAPIEYRNGSEDITSTKLPGLPKYTTINGPRPSSENDDAMAKAILDAARAGQQDAPAAAVGRVPNSTAGGGKMIQIAPPQLVIPVGATGGASSNATQSSQEEDGMEGGH
jgi:hypothetical protein